MKLENSMFVYCLVFPTVALLQSGILPAAVNQTDKPLHLAEIQRSIPEISPNNLFSFLWKIWTIKDAFEIMPT